ncbi:chemerin-like receptor 2 [Trichomycterus rosablanca]|uniref:chemerin-like receptor 2 n=1 Tax=Trichomycterus rosablanca TaxID=2290929 RepID=UPI002F3517EC
MKMEDLDYENYTYDYLEYGDFEEVKPEGYVQKQALHITSVIVYSLAFVIGVIGNGIVIWLTAFKIKRTVNTVWLQNLAIADFIFVLFLPFSIDYVLRDFNWVFGQDMCKLNSFVCTVNMYASVLSLTVLSLDRYISLVHLRWCQKFRTVQMAWIVCLLIWVVSALISSPALIFRETINYQQKVVCFNNFHNVDRHIAMIRHIAMVTLRTTVGFLLPFLTISMTAILLAIKMKSNTIHISSFSRMVLAVIVAFFLCWAPFHTFGLMELSLHTSPDLHRAMSVGFPLATSLAFFNSCVNPLLYGLFRKKMWAILKTSCLSLTKSSLRELSENLSATESVLIRASCSPEEAAASTTV